MSTHPGCVRGWTWGHLDGVDRSRPNLKVQEGLAVPVAGRNSPLRQSGNHARPGTFTLVQMILFCFSLVVTSAALVAAAPPPDIAKAVYLTDVNPAAKCLDGSPGKSQHKILGSHGRRFEAYPRHPCEAECMVPIWLAAINEQY